MINKNMEHLEPQRQPLKQICIFSWNILNKTVNQANKMAVSLTVGLTQPTFPRKPQMTA